LHEEYHGGSDSVIGEDKHTTGDASTPDNKITKKGVLEEQLADEKHALRAIDKAKRMEAEQKLFDVQKNFKERLKMIEARKNMIMDMRQGNMQRNMQRRMAIGTQRRKCD
jgi:hypothetical protein